MLILNRLLLIGVATVMVAGTAMAEENLKIRCQKTTILTQNLSQVPLAVWISVNGEVIGRSIPAGESNQTFSFHPSIANPWVVKGNDEIEMPPLYTGSCNIQVPSVKGCVDPTKTAIQMFVNTGANSSPVPTCMFNVTPIK